MTDPLPVILALGLGLLAGAWAGVTYGIRLTARRRQSLGAHAQLARLWPAELPGRSAADVLSGVIRVALGGITYEMPVLPRAASRRWLESLDARFASLASDLETAGDDTPAIMVRLVAEGDALYEMLLAYDRAGAAVLPTRDEIDESATDTEILRAVLEVWRAVNPLAATVAEMSDQTPSPSLAPPTSPPTSTAGDPTTSPTSSPTSSSSSSSTPPRTASSGTRRRSSSASSKPSGSARSSRTTRSSTVAGAAGSPAPVLAASSSGRSSRQP